MQVGVHGSAHVGSCKVVLARCPASQGLGGQYIDCSTVTRG